MSIKSMLYIFDGTVPELGALASALNLARIHRAALRVLHIAAPPLLPDTLGIGSLAVAAYGDGRVIDVLERQERDLAEAASVYVVDYCKRQGVSLLTPSDVETMGQANARFRNVMGEVEDCLPWETHTADLVIASCQISGDSDLRTVLATLFDAGRPLLLYPRHPSAEPHSIRTVVLAWDGSRAAGRALREAVPHMLHADKVYLLRVGSEASPDVVSEADVLTYLHSHCITAEIIRVERHGAIGQTLLEQAARLQADLLAMGAYGHGHVSEMLLGGATDFVLKHATLPLLLAH